VDAASYLGLGHVFTANMTGNTVLLGVALARDSGGDAARAGVALGGFCVGAAAGIAVMRTGRPWPQAASRAFLLEALMLGALLALWAALGAHRIRYLLIAASGTAMGAQSAAVRASGVRCVNTTFMTSTLLNAIARLVLPVRGTTESRAGPGLPGAAWLTYAAGAVAGAFAEKAWHAGAVAMPLTLVCAVSAAAIHPGTRGR
jgi:uncharacterized membrane protein YoaK (UPF0700 family)